MTNTFTTEVCFSNLETKLNEIVTNFNHDLFKQARWFQQKEANILKVEVKDYSQLDLNSENRLIFLLILNFYFQAQIKTKKFTARYYFPLIISQQPLQNSPWLKIKGEDYQSYVHEGINELNYMQAIEYFIQRQQELSSNQGGVFTGRWVTEGEISSVTQLTDVSTNSITFVKKDETVKTFRRLQEGVNPELEVSFYLQKQTSFDQFPNLKGYLQYTSPSKQEYSIALIQEFIKNEGDLWDYTQNHLEQLFSCFEQEKKELVEEHILKYQDLTAEVGKTIGDLHLALAAVDKKGFTPRPPKKHELNTWYREVKDNFNLLTKHLKQKKEQLPKQAELIEILLAWESKLEEVLKSIFSLRENLGKFMRCHGDLHLEQLLKVQNQIIVLDFEGEPTKSIEDRRKKYSPLKDIAGMLRSYNYASYAGCFAYANSTQPRQEILEKIENWEERIVNNFLSHYLKTVRGETDLLPTSEYFTQVVALFKLEKSLYEALYEVNNRPDWLPIPLQGIIDCLQDLN